MKCVFEPTGIVPSFSIGVELPGEARARTALLDRTMAPNWRRKSSNALRRGYVPSRGLALSARNANGMLIGTVRLWDVSSGNGVKALLLGPLAVDQNYKSEGVGAALMKAAIGKAKKLGHSAILLVGDASYYKRFGFSAELTSNLAMPGPYERERFLGLELTSCALANACGVLVPAGRRAHNASKRTRQVA